MMIPAWSFSLLILVSLFLAIPIMIGIYVYKDATNRHMNATLWTLIAVLAPTLIGFIIYLVVRSDYSALHCSNCHQPVTEEFSTCPHCGTALKSKCTHCGRPLEPGWKICPDCGTPAPDDQMPPLHPSRDTGLGKILVAVILIPLLIIGVLMVGLVSFRRGFSGSISAVDGMRVEDFQTNQTISAWLKDSDAAGNGTYVLEYQKLSGTNGVNSDYIIYRKGLTNAEDISAEAQPKSLFSEGKVIVKYNDTGATPTQDYHLYQISIYTADQAKLEIFVNGKAVSYKTTQTTQPIASFQPMSLETKATDLFNARLDYLGDNSGVLKLIEQTELPDLGRFTLELQTAQTPYGLKILYNSPISQSKDILLADSSIKLLGLIKNLDYVEITDGTYPYKLTTTEASAKLGYDVKELGASRDTLEKYMSTNFE